MRSQWNRDDELKASLKRAKQLQKLDKQLQKGKITRKLKAIRDFVDKYSDDDLLTERAVQMVGSVVEPELAENNGSIVNWVTKSGESFEGLLIVSFVDDGSIIIKTPDGESKTVKVDDLDRVSQAMAKSRDGAE